MLFSILSKDHRENWSNYVEKINRMKDKGLTNTMEIGGNHFGIDSDFLLFTQFEELSSEWHDLIQAGYFDISEMERKEDFSEEEWKEIRQDHILESFEENDFKTILKFKNGKVRTFIHF